MRNKRVLVSRVRETQLRIETTAGETAIRERLPVSFQGSFLLKGDREDFAFWNSRSAVRFGGLREN